MTMEIIRIEGPETLEGLIHRGSKVKGAVIAHPHPLYGGNMYNNVVEAIFSGFSKLNYTVLRFNFRGVGKSTGSYSDGKGEVEDIISSVNFLKSLMEVEHNIVLAGYSFGAWVASLAAPKIGIDKLLLISYPFSFYPPDPLKLYKGSLYMIVGENDPIGSYEKTEEFYKEFKGEKKLLVLPTDHFFYGMEDRIIKFIEDTFQ